MNDGLVAGLGGADEVVVGEAEVLGEREPLEGELVAVGHGILALGGGGLLDLLAVLVKAGDEEDLLAHGTMGASDDVGDDLFVGVPEVGCAVGVVDGGGDVEAFAHALGVRFGIRAGRFKGAGVAWTPRTRARVGVPILQGEAGLRRGSNRCCHGDGVWVTRTASESEERQHGGNGVTSKH